MTRPGLPAGSYRARFDAPGATGRGLGFVYSGLDVYTVAGFTALAILTVLLLPGGSVLVRNPAPVKKA